MAELNLTLSKEELKFQEYLNYLKELAAPNPPKSTLISNKGEHHASILMGALLCHTEHNLRMYCMGLTPTILHDGGEANDSTAYWNEFKSFFSNKVNQLDGKIQILVQKKDWENCEPFNIVRESCQKHQGKIEIKVENTSSREVVNTYWGKDDPINFSIYDNVAYRLEFDPEQHKAIASFNDSVISTELSSVFDKMFEKADCYNYRIN